MGQSPSSNRPNSGKTTLQACIHPSYPSPRIPVEICENVIDVLALSGPQYLVNCNLASRLFAPRCRSHIFRSINLYSSESDRRRWRGLLPLLERSPEIAFCVRELCIEVSRVDVLREGFTQTLEKLERLESLKLRHTEPGATYERSKALFSQEPGAQFPDNIRDFPASYFRLSPIKSLSVIYATIRNDEAALAGQLHPCRVERLDLRYAGPRSLGLFMKEGFPALDVSLLKTILISLIGSYTNESIGSARPLFQGGKLTSITLLYGLFMQATSSVPLSQGVLKELMKLRGMNRISVIHLILEVRTDEHFAIPMEWEAIDQELAGNGWPVLMKVIIEAKAARHALVHDCEFYLALRNLPQTHFKKLASGRRLDFSFHCTYDPYY
ncbi:hypothetical protein BXZ70DRAFT_908185 [Cristinia sonorae]|uniref:Uncharacterized protein n=1 Tax=Cristinia sonorae TaxID=1940300 RepID=A0A8K0XNV5_9AGAR|nr:hypothetical protein BXZ70DRAFT_908185 [Cristinia sonorae]